MERIKNLINDHSIHPKTLNQEVLAAFLYNDLDVIKYIIEDYKFDVTITDSDGSNFFMYAVMRDLNSHYEYECNIEIIRYLLDNCNFNINLTDQNGHTCLYRIEHDNLNIVKLLIQNGLDYNIRASNNETILHYHCRLEEPSINIIKYCINELEIDPDELINGYNCLHNVLYTSQNIDVIKFLIEDAKMSPYVEDGNNLNALSIMESSNYCGQITMYLVNTCGMRITDLSKSCYRDVNDYGGSYLRILSDVCFYDKNAKNEINHLLLNHGVIVDVPEDNPFIYDLLLDDYSETINPYTLSYSDFTHHLNLIQYEIDIEMRYAQNIQPKNKYIPDYTKHDLLFTCNDNKFYGDKETIFDQIDILRTIDIVSDDADNVELYGNLKKEYVNMYIHMCHGDTMSLRSIDKSDFVEFIKFIDKYPSKNLTLDKLEKELVEYLYENKINPNNYIKNICSRYKMKLLYMVCHNSTYGFNYALIY